MDTSIEQALAAGGLADITTTGRKSGQPRRIEIVFHNLDGRLYITGRPGSRDWYANVVAHPELILHLKSGVVAEVAATAVAITEPEDRGPLLMRIMTDGFKMDPSDATARLAKWVEKAPLIELIVA